MMRSRAKELQRRRLKEEDLETSERKSEEGSSGTAQTWKMHFKKRKFQE